MKTCVRCLMSDMADPDIIFDESGQCNYCSMPLPKRQSVVAIYDNIKKYSEGKDFDCVIGWSGGVDSTYVLYSVLLFGLKPLVVTIDIETLVPVIKENMARFRAQFDFQELVYSIPMDEQIDLELSFWKAGLPTPLFAFDHAIIAVLTEVALDYNIRHIVTGANYTYEGIKVPSWGHDYRDTKLIKEIHKRYGAIPLRNYPIMGAWTGFWRRFRKKPVFVSLLNSIEYDRDVALQELERVADYKTYGQKHFECRICRYSNGYYQLVHWGWDFGRAYASATIWSGIRTRDQAAAEYIKNAVSYKETDKLSDEAFLKKRYKLTDEEFQSVFYGEHKDFDDYPQWYVFPRFLGLLRRIFR